MTLYPIYSDLPGEPILENERVLVQKLVIDRGRSTGRPVHGANHLQVFIKGGVLKSNISGRTTLWKDGRVVWHAAPDPADRGSTNAGTSPIEMVCVTLKPVAARGHAGARSEHAYLHYPNIAGEDLLENDRVIVQRFLVAPGQWEGVHAHGPDTLFIHVKGGSWGARAYGQAEKPYDHPYADGEVGWMPAVDLSEGHESGNIGSEPIDLIWVTLKR